MVVAYDQQRAIGADGDLPWGRSLPADLAHFKRLTMHSSVIMGRRTFESIGSRPLPERENIVISRTPTGVEGVLTALSVSSALALARYPVFFIGGAQVYGEALEHVEVIYATEVQHTFDRADTHFPALDPTIWHETNREHHPPDDHNKYPFDIVTYKKVGPF